MLARLDAARRHVLDETDHLWQHAVADAEGLGLAQVGQDQEGVAAEIQSSPPSAQLCTALAEQIGQA